MHYSLRPKALQASVDKIWVAQVSLVEVDLLSEHLLKCLQALPHRPYGNRAPASNLLNPLPPEKQVRPANFVSSARQIHGKGPPDVPVYAGNKYSHLCIVLQNRAFRNGTRQ